MFGVALALVIVALIVVILLLVEVGHYRAGRYLLSGRRFALRLAAGLLMLVLLGAVFVGLFLLRLTEAQAHPTLFLGFWCGCLVVAVALVWVMLADMREVGNRLSERQHQIWRDLARFLAGQIKPEGGPPSNKGEDSSAPGESPAGSLPGDGKE